MTASSLRRPIPAIVLILALSFVSGLVWWRVLHRDPAASAGTPHSTTSAGPGALTRCVTVTAKPTAWPAPKTITLSVLNAANKTGLAASVTSALKARGFQAAKPANDQATSTITEIRYGGAYVTQARLVQLYLPGSRLVATSSTTATIVVSVGSGYRALATDAQVRAGRATSAPVRTCH